MRVISRTSVMPYKNSKKSMREIANELHADAVIEGSVMRSADRVRITSVDRRGKGSASLVGKLSAN